MLRVDEVVNHDEKPRRASMPAVRSGVTDLPAGLPDGAGWVEGGNGTVMTPVVA